MGMRARLLNVFTCAAVGVAVFSAAPPAHAKRAVGLGVGAGLAVPTAAAPFKMAPAFGFYTDIPLISTFHITPSTLVYRLDPKDGSTGSTATDVSINFKFMIPLGRLDLFGGVTAGLTATNELTPHVGGLAGASYNIVSNLDVFVNVGYKFLVPKDGGQNVHDIQIFAGPLIRFNY